MGSAMIITKLLLCCVFLMKNKKKKCDFYTFSLVIAHSASVSQQVKVLEKVCVKAGISCRFSINPMGTGWPTLNRECRPVQTSPH